MFGLMWWCLRWLRGKCLAGKWNWYPRLTLFLAPWQIWVCCFVSTLAHLPRCGANFGSSTFLSFLVFHSIPSFSSCYSKALTFWNRVGGGSFHEMASSLVCLLWLKGYDSVLKEIPNPNAREVSFSFLLIWFYALFGFFMWWLLNRVINEEYILRHF